MVTNTVALVGKARASGVTIMHPPITFAEGYNELTRVRARIMNRLVSAKHSTGSRVPGGGRRVRRSTPTHLATYAIEHGIPLASADTDFARFSELRWINPVAV